VTAGLHVLLPHRAVPAGGSLTDVVILSSPTARLTIEIDRFDWPDAGPRTLQAFIQAQRRDGSFADLCGGAMEGGMLAGVLKHEIAVSLNGGEKLESGTPVRARLVAAAALQTEVRLKAE
jgi:hypothetical protein